MKRVILSDACHAELTQALGIADTVSNVTANNWDTRVGSGPTLDYPQANPYEAPGVYAVIMQVDSQDRYTKAALAIGGTPQYRNQIVEINANADPFFNGAMSQLVAGKTLDEAFAIAEQDGKKLDFTRDQLAAAWAVRNNL